MWGGGFGLEEGEEVGACAAYRCLVAFFGGLAGPVFAAARAEEIFACEDVGLTEKIACVELCGRVGLDDGWLVVCVDVTVTASKREV